jgi:DNA-binding Xre family transcriptional regulator
MASKGGVIVVVSGEDKTGEVFTAIKRHMADTESKAKETSASLGSIGEALQKGLAAAGIAVGLREIVGRMKEMVTSTMEAGVQLSHLNQQTGISVENLSVLKYAAQATGVDFDTLTRGFKKLAVTTYDADNGNAKAAKGFAQLGISVEQLRAKGDDMYGVLTLVADRFHAMPDGIAKSDTAAKIFGARMGSEMIPVLDAMGGKLDTVKAEAQALGIVWNEEGIKKMEDLHHSAVMLQGSLQGLGLELTSDLAPALQDVASGLEAAIQKMKEWMGLTGKTPADRAHQASEVLKTIPDNIAGSSNPGQIGQSAAAQKATIEKQLASVSLSRAQKAALTQKWNEADLRQNQAYFSQLQDQITAAQVDLNNASKALAAEGWQARQSTQDWVDHAKGQLGDLLAQQNAAMDRIAAAQSNSTAAGDKAGADKGAGGAAVRGDGISALDRDFWLSNPHSMLDDLRQRQRDIAAEAVQAQQEAMEAARKQFFASDSGMPDTSAFETKMPNVTLGPQASDHSAIEGEGEKFAHGLFDPLFNMGEKWDKQWKQIRDNMLRSLGQVAESQLFGQLFGDPEGRGGAGWNGSGGRKGVSGAPDGIVGSLLSGLFARKSSTVSNGTGNAGAGTLLSAAAGALQVGKGTGSGSGGVQVILNNMGTAQTVDSTQQSGGGQAEAMILQVVLKDQQTNGAITQGFGALFGH